MPLFLSPIPIPVLNQLNLRMEALGTTGPKINSDKNLELWSRAKTPWIRCASAAVLRPTPTVKLRELMRQQKGVDNPMSYTQIMNLPEVKNNRQDYLIEHDMKNHHRLKTIGADSIILEKTWPVIARNGMRIKTVEKYLDRSVNKI